MITELPETQYEVKPILFDYLNSKRIFFGGFTKDGVSESEGVTYFRMQDEMIDVLDFNTNFDSVNILTKNKLQWSDNHPSSLTVYEDGGVDKDCSEQPTPCYNYWLTFPQDISDAPDDISDVKSIIRGNVIPLKNNLTETNTTPCHDCYREYHNFNFGVNGLDNLKPELLYTTRKSTKEYNDLKFTFRIPDESEDLPINDLDWLCFGSIAGDCPLNSDRIIWGDGVETWLKHNPEAPCSPVWVDRVYGTDSCPDGLAEVPELQSVTFSDIPSTLILVSDAEYQYIRPQFDVVSDITGNPNLIFTTYEVVGDNIIDGSSLNNDARFI